MDVHQFIGVLGFAAAQPNLRTPLERKQCDRRGEVSSPDGLGNPTLTPHLSPRWGFRIFMFPVFYTPAAPLGLCWVSLLLNPTYELVFPFSGLQSCKSLNPANPDSDNVIRLIRASDD